MHTYRAKRVLRAERKSSSSPVIVDTDGGAYFVKLRGAAQGTLALVAEIIVADLAEAIDLSVPARALITIDDDLETNDRNDELLQLIGFSRGLNLGLQYLERARDLRGDEAHLIDEDTASRIVWLDGLVMNPDRTATNPNVLAWRGKPWLIDHGAALGFQHDWSRVDEQTAQKPSPLLAQHFLRKRATRLCSPRRRARGDAAPRNDRGGGGVRARQFPDAASRRHRSRAPPPGLCRGALETLEAASHICANVERNGVTPCRN